MGSARFWNAVRAEARATWVGRFRWLWLAAAVAVELTICAGPVGFNFQNLWLFCFGCWLTLAPPVWLCADLLSTHFKANPEPLRPSRPAELRARVIGRLLPYYGAALLWIATLTGRILFAQLLARGTAPANLGQVTWQTLPAFWIAWVSVFLISGWPYGAVAALLSATARRPRRVQISLGVFAVALFAEFVDIALTVPIMGSQTNLAAGKLIDYDALHWFLIAPNFSAGVSMIFGACTQSTLIKAWGEDFPRLCWIASAGFVLLTIPPVLWTWWIAARRSRRHPFTAEGHAEPT